MDAPEVFVPSFNFNFALNSQITLLVLIWRNMVYVCIIYKVGLLNEIVNNVL